MLTRPSSNVPDRRRTPRFEAEADVLLSILFPEETFSPQRLPGTTMDVSQSGVRLRTTYIPKDLYRKLIHAVRHAKVEYFVGGEKTAETQGQIVWMDFREGDPPECQIGVSFYTPDEGLVERLRNLPTSEAT